MITGRQGTSSGSNAKSAWPALKPKATEEAACQAQHHALLWLSGNRKSCCRPHKWPTYSASNREGLVRLSTTSSRASRAVPDRVSQRAWSEGLLVEGTEAL